MIITCNPWAAPQVPLPSPQPSAMCPLTHKHADGGHKRERF